MKIYNSLTRKKEDFVPIDGKKVKLYACGITPSGEAHIGHLFQALIYDNMRKFLEKEGYDVTYARNYTDVDDKIITKSNNLNVSAKDYAEQMIKAIDNEMAIYQIDEPNIWLRATENIDNMIEFISKLVEKGYAYPTKNGDVYFAVEKFKSYGKLSGRNTDDALNGVRIENDEEKNDSLDFALWKSAKPGEPSWPSPWGNGRPGWHIECSVMNHHTFGEQIDIHGGGRDLVFPHHENEIAQSEALTGKPFAKYWTHNGLIKVDGQKMSKSLGNSLLMKDLREKYHVESIKYALLINSYHTDINITESYFSEPEKHLYSFYKVLQSAIEKFGKLEGHDETVEKNFDEAMRDDLNTAKALSYLHGIFKTAKEQITNGDREVLKTLNTVVKTYSLIGIFKTDANDFINYVESKQKDDVPSEVKEKAEARWQAKKNRDFATADTLRAEISSLGYEIKDTKDGYEILKK